MADRSIAKYLKQETSKVISGLNEEAGFSIMPSWINRGLHPWLWLMCKQTVVLADPMSSKPTDWFDDNSLRAILCRNKKMKEHVPDGPSCGLGTRVL